MAIGTNFPALSADTIDENTAGNGVRLQKWISNATGGGVNSTAAGGEVLAGTRVILVTDAQYLRFDPGAGDKTVTLPAARAGLAFWVAHAGAANNLLVKDAGGATISTISNGTASMVVSSGSAWIKFV